MNFPRKPGFDTDALVAAPGGFVKLGEHLEKDPGSAGTRSAFLVYLPVPCRLVLLRASRGVKWANRKRRRRHRPRRKLWRSCRSRPLRRARISCGQCPRAQVKYAD